MFAVEFRGVWKRYGSVEAVKDLNLTCGEGEFLALLGPSGCGKTSSLRMLAGLETISEGDILIGTRRVNDVPPAKRDVAMVFEDYALYPHMSVEQNIAFPLVIRKIDRDVIREKVDRAIQMLSLEEIRGSNVQELSGGAQQRTSIGRVIVREPQVMLMDEPISHLDSAHRMQLRTELKRLQRNLGVSTVYVTHDQTEAMALADRVAVMNLGVLQQCAPPDELYKRPANLFVAGFIGDPPMNFLSCEFDADDSVLRGEGFAIPLSNGDLRERAHSSDRPLALGFRPSDAEISGNLQDADLCGQCVAIEPRGDTTVVSIVVGQEWLLVESEPDIDFGDGDLVGLKIPESAVYLFDKETGISLQANNGAG